MREILKKSKLGFVSLNVEMCKIIFILGINILTRLISNCYKVIIISSHLASFQINLASHLIILAESIDINECIPRASKNK